MAIGPRIGLRIAPKIGLATGLGAFAIGGSGFIGQGNPNKAWLQIIQSNNLGLGVAANIAAAGFPGIDSPLAAVGWYRRGGNSGTKPLIVEAATTLRPRVTNFGSYAAGTCGIELTLGRDLNTGEPNVWNGIQIGIDGSGFHDEWDNPAFPGAGETMLSIVTADVTALLATWNAHLELIVPIFGEADGAESPDFTNIRTHMTSFITSGLLTRFGPAKVVCPLMSWHAGSHDNIGIVNRQIMEFCSLTPNSDFVRMSERAFRDGVHYADTNGYGEFGVDVAAKYFFINTGSVRSAPYVAVTGDPVTASSGSGLVNVIPEHRANDIIVIELGSNGTTPYGVPTGTGGTWAQFTNSPQQDAGSGLNSRYQGFWIRASGTNSVGTGTIADIGGDGGKQSIPYVIRGCRTTGNPFEATAGATAATSTTVTCPAVTTLGTNRLITATVSGQIDSVDAQITAWANANLTDLKEEFDTWTNTGTGFGLAMASGVMPTANDTGATTATAGTTTTQALHTTAWVGA